MKKLLFFAVPLLLITGCKDEKTSDENQPQMALNYPETKKQDTVDTYFGTEVADPYRWLEDDMSEETADWVKRQNEVTQNYLSQIRFRESIEKRLEEIWNYEKISAPFKEGNYTYFYRNDGLQNQSVLYRFKTGEDMSKAEVFLDPNTFSEEGTTSLGGMSFTEDGSMLAYSISEGGSDWRKIIVMDTETKEQVGDTLRDVKFSGMSWKGNDGFYYSSYDKPEGSELSAKTDWHKLYYHKMGTPQSADQVVFGKDESEKYRYVGGRVTDDDQYLVISASKSTNGNKLFIQPLADGEDRRVTVLDDFDSNSYILHNDGRMFYVATDLNAPNNRIATFQLENPSPENWKELIAETENVLNPSTGGGYIFARYTEDAISKVEQYDMQGNKVRDVELPGVGTASGFGAEEEETELYYSFTNYTTPSTIYHYDIETGESELYRRPEIDFKPEEYESTQVFYESKDGTKVPMIITHKKGIKLDGNHPTILYGYGGFNISLNPSFSVVRAAWLEMGGIYAVANLRGGGEYGKDWHDAGIKMKKQNVFDDFIAAAEYLIQNDYTSSDKLAIQGGSNGGLLVGATMTQRPDLMAVALPAVGVLDMLRYHKFTAGAGWAYDYGTADDSREMFEYLKGYSPLHNVEKGVKYPATLITTGDHDDRVVPAHSFKFAAELQDKQAGDDPVLIRIETDAGHGAGKPTSKTIEEWADIYGFTLYNMGYENLPGS